MMPVTAEQIDRAAMLAHLQWITRRWPELGEPTVIELRALGDGLTRHSARFAADAMGLDMAVDWAAGMNAIRGRNLYPVMNPLRDTKGRDATDADVIASIFHWADADKLEAIDRLKAWGGPKWRAVVKTGSIPHDRVHVYWEMTEWQRDLAAWRATQQAIAARFMSDSAVINPSRIMRLAGSISWPSDKKKARGYVSEVATLRAWPERDMVDSATFARAFGTVETQASSFQIDTGEQYAPTLDRERAAIAATSGMEWHNNVIRLVGSYVARGLSDAEIHALTDALTLPGYTVEQTRREVQTAIDGARRKGWTPEPQQHHRAEPVERISAFFRASDFEGVIVPQREWHVPDLIPASQVTMMGGDGGTGKSLLLQQLAVSTVLGTSWIGQNIDKPGPVVLISAEDDRDELHRRLADIAEAEGAAFSDLRNLIVRSLAGEDALLATLDRKSNALVQTPLFAELDECIGDVKPSMVGLDTLSDLHSGEENSRAHARQFIGMIRGLAIRHRCAVVLLAHPSLTGISTGTGMSGSTAWNNSVRSRLYLERVKDDDGHEANPDARILSGKKANYARAGAEIMLTWQDGVFVSETPRVASGLDRLAASAKAERVFTRLLREFSDQGRYVSASPCSTYAPTVFAASPGAEGCTKRALVAAMEVLFAKGAIKVGTHGKGAKARSHIVFTSETM